MSAVIERLYAHYRAGHPVSTDTRQLPAGSIFFALRGPRFDGNQYAAQALDQGAGLVVVDRPVDLPADRAVVVDDVLTTLQALARHHRRQLSLPVIAIGGSNGKTTTKELTAAVLGARYRTFATRGNLNNHIGVPLSLLSIAPDTEMAIIEMGANGPNEIELLCQIAEPTHGLITNIGLDHLEGFGSLEGVARANSELFYYLLQHGGTAFVNTLEPHVVRMAARLPHRITYPQPGDDYTCTALPSDFFLKIAAANGAVIETQLLGQYNFANIATALCVGTHFGVPPDGAHRAVAAYAPANNRSQLVRTTHNILLLDAYNANPSSMEASVRSLAALRVPRRVAILGDMLEMGSYSADVHRQMGELVAGLGLAAVYLCGPEMQHAKAALPAAHWFADRDALRAHLVAHPLRDAHVLLKGSRGIGLEAIAEVL